VSGEEAAGSGTLDEAVAFVAQRLEPFRPIAGIVLGSGLGGLASTVKDPVSVPYGEIPGFPPANVEGHEGIFTAGTLEDVPVLLQRGRLHLYEGHDAQAVVLPIRTLAELGVEILIVTNAAGGIRFTFEPPLLMLIADHVNLMWRNPLVGPVVSNEERFPDMSSPYDAELRALARETALATGIPLEEGVYAGVMGPNYETPAEIRMIEHLGADAVGMSTVPEVIAAQARGIRVLGVSAITNRAAGASPTRLTHDEVLEAGKHVSADLATLIRGVLRGIDR
jgi:purine-nucleoside phosphorylase